MTKPCTIQGIRFASRAAAAQHFGVSSGMIGHVVTGRRKEESLGFGKGGSSTGYKKPLTINGVTYESRAAAARSIGVPPNEICVFLRVQKRFQELQSVKQSS